MMKYSQVIVILLTGLLFLSGVPAIANQSSQEEYLTGMVPELVQLNSTPGVQSDMGTSVPSLPGPGAPDGPGFILFPMDNIWNTPVDSLPVDPHSSGYIATIGSNKRVHPDFGSGLWENHIIGIPYMVVNGTQPKITVFFDQYGDESDPGPYPVPANPVIEGDPGGGGDRHMIMIDHDNHVLYELYAAHTDSSGNWYAGSGAVYNLDSNILRTDGWTSADAAGLPIMPGLVRYDEVAAGEIKHAIRFTAPETRNTYVWPARHFASDLTGTQYPPMGQRFRLKNDFNISGYSPEVRVILTALKKYGMVLADNGASWYLSGAPDERWNNDRLVNELHQVPGSAFEAVDVSSLMVNPGSGQVRLISSQTKIGVFRSGFWILDTNGNYRWDGTTGSNPDVVAGFGMAGDKPVVGNWNHADSEGDKIGVFRNGTWLIDNNGNFQWDGIDKYANLGQAGDIPLVGDWNSNGDKKIGVFRNGFWMLDGNGNYLWDGPGTGLDVVAGFGMTGDIPVVGDWYGTAQDKIGLFRNGFWILDKNGNFQWDGVGTGADLVAGFGMAGDVPVVRDWNGDSMPEIAVFRPGSGQWIIDSNGNYQWDGTGTGQDVTVSLGESGDVAIAGDWNATGKDKIGIFRSGFWIIDYNGNYRWDGPPDDKVAGFGMVGDIPVTGIFL